MPFFIAANPHSAVQVIEMRHDGEHLLGALGSISDEQLVQITDIAVGTINYPLRQELRGNYVRAMQVLTVNGVSPLILGEGKSSEEAKTDFCLKVHAAIQELIHKRPFEMTDRDRILWETLNEIIDTTVYRNTTPITVRQFGRIRRARPYPDEVTWENGSNERLNVTDVADPDYVNYKPGQPFEAVVERDPLSFKLIRVLHIERRRSPRRLSSTDEAEMLDESGSLHVFQTDDEWKP